MKVLPLALLFLFLGGSIVEDLENRRSGSGRRAMRGSKVEVLK